MDDFKFGSKNITFRHIGNNNSNQENYSIQPMVSKDKCNNEKGDTKKNGHASDDVDEMSDLLGNWGITRFQSRSQTSNPTHDSVISNVDNYTFACSFNSVGGEKGQILGFNGVIISTFRFPGLRFRLA